MLICNLKVAVQVVLCKSKQLGHMRVDIIINSHEMSFATKSIDINIQSGSRTRPNLQPG
jgi:hypothetical protein